MAGIQARYGISALDLGHKEYAQDDELMVRGDDGRMYYKRTDGVIVAYADKDLSEDEVISNTMGVLMGIDGLVLPEKNISSTVRLIQLVSWTLCQVLTSLLNVDSQCLLTFLDSSLEFAAIRKYLLLLQS